MNTRLSTIALELVRQTDRESHRADWSRDARRHFQKASIHALKALVEIRRAETGVAATEVTK